MFEDDQWNQTKDEYREKMNNLSNHFFTKYKSDVPDTLAMEILSEDMDVPISMTQLTDGNKIHDYFLNPVNDIIQEGDALLASNDNYGYFIIGKKNNEFLILPVMYRGKACYSVLSEGTNTFRNAFIFHPMVKIRKWNNIPQSTMIVTNRRGTSMRKGTKRKTIMKRTTRRRQLGGHVVTLDNIELQDWMPLQCNKTTNCGPSSMAMLNYFEKNRMEELALDNPDGMFFSDIIKTLTDLYKVPHSLTLISNRSDGSFTFDWKNILDFILGKNEYTLCFLDYTPDSMDGGHYVVIGRNNNGKLVIHDPQALKTSIGMRDIMKYLEHLDAYRVFVFNQVIF